MKDKHGKELKIGAQVVVPDPEPDDIWSHSFVATVVDPIERFGTVIVEDQDSDMFEVAADRLELSEE